MSTVLVNLPDSLHRRLEELAAREGISLDQFLATAAAEKMSALLTEEYLEERARGGNRAAYDAVLAAVPDVEPEPEDDLPSRKDGASSGSE